MSHTPAPWKAEIENCGDGLNVTTLDGHPIAHTATVRDTNKVIIFPEEAKANARLIAASPELLSVLESWYETRTTEDRLAWDKSARSAIAKAKGAA